jgi:hypothetical protein
MFADRHTTCFDHGGAVWWDETEGQFGSPERLYKSFTLAYYAGLSIASDGSHPPDTGHLPFPGYRSFAYSAAEKTITAANNQLLPHCSR